MKVAEKSKMRTTAIILAVDDILLLTQVGAVRRIEGRAERGSVAEVIRGLVDDARPALESEAGKFKGAVTPVRRTPAAAKPKATTAKGRATRKK